MHPAVCVYLKPRWHEPLPATGTWGMLGQRAAAGLKGWPHNMTVGKQLYEMDQSRQADWQRGLISVNMKVTKNIQVQLAIIPLLLQLSFAAVLCLQRRCRPRDLWPWQVQWSGAAGVPVMAFNSQKNTHIHTPMPRRNSSTYRQYPEQQRANLQYPMILGALLF